MLKPINRKVLINLKSFCFAVDWGSLSFKLLSSNISLRQASLSRVTKQFMPTPRRRRPPKMFWTKKLHVSFKTLETPLASVYIPEVHVMQALVPVIYKQIFTGISVGQRWFEVIEERLILQFKIKLLITVVPLAHIQGFPKQKGWFHRMAIAVTVLQVKVQTHTDWGCF